MEDEARKLGFSPRVWSTNLSGEADQVGGKIIESIGRGEALLAIGETTVTVRGRGAGGRNQQLVISALPYLTKGQLLAAVNTDGHDNSDFAGAIGDWETVRKTTKLGLDSAAYARENDSFTFFKAVGDGIETGELESNFADIVICLWEKV
jgi:glycerate-2-kinase